MRRRSIRAGLAVLGALALSPPLAAMPEAASKHQDTAARALDRGDGLAAEVELKAALAAGAVKADVSAAMGEALLLQGNFAAARQWLARGDFAGGTQARGWAALGKVERAQGNFAAAAAAYDKAVRLTPKDPVLWVEIGRLRYLGGNHRQAEQAVDTALSFDPQNARALEFKAQLVGQSLGYAAAADYYDQALAVAPDDLALLIGNAAALGESGQHRQVLTMTRKVLGQAGGAPLAWFYQAVLAARVGNVELARAMLNRVGERLDDVPAALLLRGAMELEAGNANRAAQLLGQLVERQPANPRGQLLFARALLESGDYQALLTRFGPLAARPDASPYLLTIMARGYEDVGDRVTAGQLLDRAATIAPSVTMPIYQPGGHADDWEASQGSLGAALAAVRSLIAAGNKAGAVGVATRFLQMYPGSGDALGLAGDAQLATGNAAAALQLYRAASAVRFPESMLVRIGEASDLLGHGAAMPGLVARYAERFPGSRLALRMAATMAAATQDWASARALLENLRLRGGNSDVRLLADLSYAQLRTGDARVALDSATRAWLLQPASPAAAQARGMALVELEQDPALARQLLEQAQRSGGNNPLLGAALARLK